MEPQIQPQTEAEVTVEVPQSQTEVSQVSQTPSTTLEPTAPQTPKITFDDFAKVELKIGKIESAEIIEKSEKLLKLKVDFGEVLDGVSAPRQVISGIRKQFQDPAELVGRSFVFVTNLEPRPIMGFESHAMIVAGKSDEGLALMTPTIDMPAGTSLS